MSFPVVKQMPKMTRKVTARANRGLYLDRSSLTIPEGGLSACHNVRIKEGEVRSENMGWTKFMGDFLNGQVLLIDNFLTRSGTQTLIFGTTRDLYRFDDTANEPLYITPTYTTGLAEFALIAPDEVVGNGGTAWNTGTPKNVKAGDFIYLGQADYDEIASDPADEGWHEIASVVSDTALTLVTDVGSNSSLGGDAYTIRQTFTGDESDIWDTAVFPLSQTAGDVDDDIWYATNNVEMVKWNGNDDTVSRYDPGFVARSLMFHKNIMLYLGITESGEYKSGSVRNSAISDPENVSTIDASEWFATDGVDAILTGVALGDTVAIYCERSINVAQFVGYPVVYAVRTAVPDTGVVSGRSVVNLGDFHEFIGNDHGYRFDGVTLSEMGRHVMREAIRTIDPARPEKALAYRDRENGEIQFVIPKTTDEQDLTVTSRAPEIAYTSNYQETIGTRESHPFTIRDLPATAMGSYQRGDTLRFDDFGETLFDEVDFAWNDRFFEAQFPFILFGDKDGYVYTLGTSGTQDGTAISSYARFPRAPVADGFRRGVVKRIEPFAVQRSAATFPLGVLLWVTDQAEGNLSLAVQIDYDLTQAGTRYVSPRKAGRFAEVEFAAVSSTSGFSITGFAIYSVPGGER